VGAQTAIVEWPNLQLLDTWSVRAGGHLLPGKWSDSSSRPSDSPAMIPVMNVILHCIPVRTVAALTIDYLAIAPRVSPSSYLYINDTLMIDNNTRML
jgi:hypothetical protein